MFQPLHIPQMHTVDCRKMKTRTVFRLRHIIQCGHAGPFVKVDI
jgi:hypothetical protein